MKRVLGFSIVLVLIISTLPSIAAVRCQITEYHESWDKDVEDMLDYIHQCYDPNTQTFTWLYPEDGEKYQLFFDTSKEVQIIREQNKDASLINLVDVPQALEYLKAGLTLLKTNYKHSEYMFSVLEQLNILEETSEVTTIVTSLNQHIEQTEILLGDGSKFTSVTEMKSFVQTQNFAYTVAAVDWSKVDIVKQNLKIGPLNIIITLWKFADAVYNHNFVISNNIEEALVEPDNIVQKIKAYELEAETGFLVVDISEIVAGTVGTTIGQAVGLALGGSIGASFIGAFPPAPLVGATVGYFAGGYLAEQAFEKAAGILASAVMKSPLLKCIDELGIQYEKISAKITGIYSEGVDYIVSTREKIYVTIENTGMYEKEFIVSANPSFWEIADYWGWLEWERVDWDNVKKVKLKPLESATVWFAATPDGVHADEDLAFNVWYETGLLWWYTQSILDSDAAQFHSLPFVVEAYITVSNYVPFVAQEETIEITIDVLNPKTITIDFVLDVALKDPTGEVEKYNQQLSVFPAGQVTLEADERATFIVTLDVPLDAPVGYYQLGVDCLKYPGTQKYLDNLSWKNIFFLYGLDIWTPTSLQPAKAGDPSAPNPIHVFVTGLPQLPTAPEFVIYIGSGGWMAQHEVIGTMKVPAGYLLKVTPPTQASEGSYSLEVHAFWGESQIYHSSDTEPNAVEYTKAPSVAPIDKGLAWLRTSQLSDGSWQGTVGVTALCSLAFLNAGFDENDPTVQKAIQYLISRYHNGPIYTTQWGLSRATYETSLALLSLVATHNSNYQGIITTARDWLVSSQWDESCWWGGIGKDHWYYGGFGYGYSVRPDLSNTQFALLALDAAGLPKDDPAWVKAQVFLQRCQRVNFPITLNIEGSPYTVQPGSYAGHDGGYDGGFVYTVDNPYPYGGSHALGSMTAAGIWGLLLSGVSKTDPRVTSAINWAIEHFTWETNVGAYGYRRYYYYLSMAKALTMYGEKSIGGHDWYQEFYNKITSPTEMIAVGVDKAKWVPTTYEDYVPDLSTAYAILSMQTRAAAPPVQRLSYLTFILRSNCLLRILDSEGNLVGYNYMTGLGENNIPTAIYSGPFFEPQYIVIINPEPGTYKLELIGTSEGPYELTIQGNYGEETTDSFEYEGEIKPAELHGSDLTVTAVVGPVDIYANPPEFEKIIDNTPPTTTLEISEPKYVDPMDNIFVTSATPFTLTAEDNPGGTDVASIFYRIYNSIYDSSWLGYSAPFYLTGLSDGKYSADYYSTDTIGNTEPIHTISITLDNSGPLITIENPPAGWALQDGVTFIALPTDLSGTHSLNFSIREADGDQGIPVGFEDIPATYNTTTGKWELFFNTLQLPDGFYIVLVSAEDNLGHTASITVHYSIRNWAVLQLLPATPNNKAGRTMPVKFALRVAAAVDPNQPFVYNEELTIKIYAVDNPSNILQTSTFGDTALDYRINTLSEQYITNFKTLRTPKTYIVEVWRKDMLIGDLGFQTTNRPGDIDGDGSVDGVDFGIFAPCYGSSIGQPTYNAVADIDGDGDVDGVDFGTFAPNYGKNW